VSPDDLETLTARLIQLLQDEALRIRMGAAGQQRIEEHFTFAQFEQGLTRILEATD
jgi:glycosyltransferase involved in cell wall biosynthesis